MDPLLEGYRKFRAETWPTERARSIEEMDEGVKREAVRRWKEKSGDRD